MISDRKLIRISLLVAVIGIACIYLVTFFIGPESRTIASITENDAGKHIIVNATVLEKRVKDGNVFLDLGDGTGNITAVMFERTARGTDIYAVKEGDDILINGQINIYKDELEIIANSVVIWK